MKAFSKPDEVKKKFTNPQGCWLFISISISLLFHYNMGAPIQRGFNCKSVFFRRRRRALYKYLKDIFDIVPTNVFQMQLFALFHAEFNILKDSGSVEFSFFFENLQKKETKQKVQCFEYCFDTMPSTLPHYQT